MRGRLINPFLLELKQLDTEATAADPDGAGELTSGYDPDFKEPMRLADGTSARKEKDSIFLPVQVEPVQYEKLTQQAAGNDPNSQVTFIMHFQDIEDMGLLDGNGNALLHAGDRAVAIYRLDDRSLIMKLGLAAEGLFLTEAQPRSFGLSGGARNLLMCTFDCREKTFRGGG